MGCYLGLRPRCSQLGDHDPQLGITKAGYHYLRTLLALTGPPSCIEETNKQAKSRKNHHATKQTAFL